MSCSSGAWTRNPPDVLTPAMVDECARAVFNDVAIDGEVELTYEPVGDPSSDFGCLIYPGTQRPEPPLALHEPFREYTWREFTPSHTTKDDVLGFMASEVQTLVQLGRWMSGLDPTWPPCGVHAGRHPLKVEWLDGEPVWLCWGDLPAAVRHYYDRPVMTVEIGRRFDPNVAP